ncbi:MAG: ribosome small subunit-dependent GTPase A [Acidobacteriales bacterium]|nr:ribosome small subunit-dependent GTPase A [Terriglobales bacterium]
MFLERLGADQSVYGAFSSYARQQMVLARVAIAQRDLYYLYSEDGPIHAQPSGRLYYRTPDHSSLPVTGDWVAARIVGPEQALVEAVLPRRTCLSRRAAGRRDEEQSLAANVDVVFLVCGLDGDFNLRRLERYLALVATSGASPVVVLNKADLCADLAGRIAETAAIARRVPVVAASTLDPQGLDDLHRFLTPGVTVALLGSSGVGKSTIVNHMLGEERFRTNEVRMWDSRGRHTTVRRELTPLPHTGALIDTPGMRELQLWAGTESIDAVFDDITAIAENCRFRDCSHSGEPGCAVAAALEGGQVHTDRWASFQKLRAEAEWHAAMADPLAALERKRKWKAIHKQARAISKSRR